MINTPTSDMKYFQKLHGWHVTIGAMQMQIPVIISGTAWKNAGKGGP